MKAVKVIGFILLGLLVQVLSDQFGNLWGNEISNFFARE